MRRKIHRQRQYQQRQSIGIYLMELKLWQMIQIQISMCLLCALWKVDRLHHFGIYYLLFNIPFMDVQLKYYLRECLTVYWLLTQSSFSICRIWMQLIFTNWNPLPFNIYQMSLTHSIAVDWQWTLLTLQLKQVLTCFIRPKHQTL